MRALIFEPSERPGAGALDIAGLPLVVRQLQWLRDLGIEDVVVEIAADASASERGALLLGTDPLTARVSVLPTRAPVGIDLLAARAGVADDEPFLALPADLLLHATFPLPEAPVRVVVAPPAFAGELPPVTIAVRTLADDTEADLEIQTDSSLTSAAGWALTIHDRATAHALTCAILEGKAEGVLVHAAEVRPGVWLARGARVAEEAILVPPVLLEAEARVFAKAHLGPNVVVGKRALIERDVVLSEVQVEPETLVGEGSRFHQAQLDARGFTSLADGTRTDIDDALLLASTVYGGPAILPRAVALLLAAVLTLVWLAAAPLLALLGKKLLRAQRFRGQRLHVGALGIPLLDLVPALWDVVRGRRDLVGVARADVLADGSPVGAGPVPLRPGAIDVTAALAPDASDGTRRAMWCWYLQNKSATLDRRLLEERLRGPQNARRSS